MAKKIRFALKMKDGTEVRNLQELQEHFDIDSVMAYYLNGKLETWLDDRYYDEEADQVRELDPEDSELSKKLCEIFQVEYVRDALTSEEIEARKQKIERLRGITDDEEIIDKVDSVAFTQEELADLLDAGFDTIYLCGKDFQIPLGKGGVTYIGIQTNLIIPQEQMVQYELNNIRLVNVRISKSKEKVGCEAFKDILSDISELLCGEEDLTQLSADKKEAVQSAFQELMESVKKVVADLKVQSYRQKSKEVRDIIEFIKELFFRLGAKNVIIKYYSNCMKGNERCFQAVNTVVNRLFEESVSASVKSVFWKYIRSVSNTTYYKLPFKAVIFHDFANGDIMKRYASEIAQNIDYRRLDFIIAVFIFIENFYQESFRKYMEKLVLKNDSAILETVLNICQCILEPEKIVDDAIINKEFTMAIYDYVKGAIPKQTRMNASRCSSIIIPSFLEK